LGVPLAIASLAACRAEQAQAPPPPAVTVSQPVRRTVIDSLQATGNTRAFLSVQLVARVEGYLEKVLFRDGQAIKKGQLLFVIQRDTYRATLQQQEGNVLAQKAALAHADIELERYQELSRRKAASQQDVETWHYNRDAARAALLTARAQRDLAKLNLGYTAISAPFDGRVDRHLVDVGNLVGSGGAATALAQVTQLDPIYVYFSVSERDIAPFIARRSRLEEPGRQPPEVFAGLAGEEGYPHRGQLDFAATSVDVSTGTLLLRGLFPNPDGRMLPGQYARLKVPVGEERSALLVPQVAVRSDQEGSYALLVNAEGVVQRRGVETGSRHEDLVVIESGLTGQEWVVVKGVLKAVPGRKVEAVRSEPAQPARGVGGSK
jgi:RND family efflux transporter MFP subunit